MPLIDGRTGKDPWEDICAEAGLRSPFPFVSPPISKNLIAKYAPRHEPRLIIPIYSKQELERKFPFLYLHHLAPLRIDNGTAVLTKAELFQTLEPIRKDNICLEHDKKRLSSLQTEVQTEAKYLAMALHSGVFQDAFSLDSDIRLELGIFGKMNLPSREIHLIDPGEGKQYRVHLSNVQFELDFSLEDDQYIYLIEAKIGKPSAKSFNILQLFYPYALVQDKAQKDKKQVRTFFVNISPGTDHSIDYDFHEYSFTIPFVVNSIEFREGMKVRLVFETGVNSRLEHLA